MPSSSSSSSQSERGGMTIDIRPMIEDVSQVMTKHITSILSGVIGEYTIYKETHDTIMGLPCVRKLQERISELEQHCGGEGGGASMSASSMTTNTGGGSREEEVAQLQSAIADLNRYIHALESKVDMKSAVSSGDGGHIQQQHHHQDEESVRLEIHETDDGDEGGEDHCESTVETLSTHKNVIITTEALEETEAEAEPEEADAEAEEQEEAEQEEAEQEEAEQEEAEEPEQEEADAEAEEAEPDAEAEAEDAEADAEAEDAEDAEDAEAQPEPEAEEAEDAEAQPEPEPEEEETEEVEEVKIKGKTYFTTNPQNGIIYACVDDDVGDEVGVFKNGVAVFNKGKK